MVTAYSAREPVSVIGTDMVQISPLQYFLIDQGAIELFHSLLIIIILHEFISVTDDNLSSSAPTGYCRDCTIVQEY